MQVAPLVAAINEAQSSDRRDYKNKKSESAKPYQVDKKNKQQKPKKKEEKAI